MKTRKIWISCPQFTIKITVRDRRIIETAPMAKTFIGQRFANLVTWMRKFGDVKAVDLNEVKYG